MSCSIWTLETGRWRSPDYLRWVRSLPCCCRTAGCPNCSRTGPPSRVEAAHFRFGAAVGMGTKPDDLLAYPLSAIVHARFHAEGQPSPAWQVERVVETLRAAFRAGIIDLGPERLAEVEAFGLSIPF